MTKNMFRAFALTMGAAAMLCPQTAQAAEYQTKKFAVPFAFQVNNVQLPAGEYRIEKRFGSEIIMLVNQDTRRTVQMLRQQDSRSTGNYKLAFEKTETGYQLKLKS